MGPQRLAALWLDTSGRAGWRWCIAGARDENHLDWYSGPDMRGLYRRGHQIQSPNEFSLPGDEAGAVEALLRQSRAVDARGRAGVCPACSLAMTEGKG